MVFNRSLRFCWADFSWPPAPLPLVARLYFQPGSSRSAKHWGVLPYADSTLVPFFRNSSHFQCPDSDLRLLILAGLTCSAWSYLAVLRLGSYPQIASGFPYPNDCRLVLLIKGEFSVNSLFPASTEEALGHRKQM